jgi:YbgC/YbaW family acyl-CoA thioester hydrolase
VLSKTPVQNNAFTQRFPMPYSTQHTVRFAETDPAGIVFFARFFEYAHLAYEDMLVAGGLPLSHFFESQCGMPLVHSEATYSKPCRLGEILRLELAVDKVGNRSIRYGVQIVGPDNALRAKVTLTHAILDLKIGKTMAVPEELLTALRNSGALTPREEAP